MQKTHTQSVLGSTGISVYRLGLSTTYRPGKKTVYTALEEGINFFFGFGIDTQLQKGLRDVVGSRREDVVIATGPYNLIWGHTSVRRTLEKRLRQFRTDYIDVFLFLGVLKEAEFPQRVRDEMMTLREEGKVRAIGLSTHNRKLAGKLADEGNVDALMIRYNAAHRGAEKDIFPYLDSHHPGVIGYTATRWRDLIRKPRTWLADRPIPDAGMCYRFVLSNPDVNVCLTAPTSERQLRDNIRSVESGPLDEAEMAFMMEFGDVVYRSRKWFM